MHKHFPLLAFLTALLGGCMTLPPSPNQTAMDPSNPSAPEASAPRLRPNLVATTRVYLDPSAGQGAQTMDHSKMKGMEGMDHSQMKGMEGMDHSQMPGMGASPSAAAAAPAMSKETVETQMKQTSDEMKRLSDALKAKSDAAKPAPSSGEKPAAARKSAEAAYTCPMHPQINEPKPGNCPICGMTLIKKSFAPEGAKP